MNKFNPRDDKLEKIYEEKFLNEKTNVNAIRKKADQFKKKLQGKPVKENFGQKELRALEDFADIWNLDYQDRQMAIQIVNSFANWVENYTG